MPRRQKEGQGTSVNHADLIRVLGQFDVPSTLEIQGEKFGGEQLIPFQ